MKKKQKRKNEKKSPNIERLLKEAVDTRTMFLVGFEPHNLQ